MLEPAIQIEIEEPMKILSATLVCGAMLLVADAAQGQSAPANVASPATPGTTAPAATAPPAVTPKDIGAPEAWSDKPVGKYDIVINIPEGAMPVEITISQSASGLSALFYKVGDNDAHVMGAAVKG